MREEKNAVRQSNIELLRIISMCMIIAMHYMTKGMKIDKLSVDGSAHNITFWLIYAFCLSSVNAYVLISGYFAPDSKWSITKVLRLWGEVLFYSIGVPLVMSLFGAFDFKHVTFAYIQQIFMPVTYEHYWFATAFIFMLILSPVLNLAITGLDRRVLGSVLLLLILVFTGIKSVDPYLIPWDRYGNDVIWFVVLYLTAGYVRMYGIPFIDTRRTPDAEERTAVSGERNKSARGWMIYIVFSILTFVIAIVYAQVVRSTGKMEYAMDMTYCYNYVTIFIASIGLFTAFVRMKIGHIAWINRIAGCTFGIYLFHDNIALRSFWPKVPGLTAASGQWWQILHMLLCIIVIFAAGTAVDLIRQSLAALIRSLIKRGDGQSAPGKSD